MQKFIEKLIERLERDTRIGRKSCEAIVEDINQFAEEYNNDFCEWHKVKNGNAYKCNTHAEIHDSRVLDWYVCPYCEKKIKVVE